MASAIVCPACRTRNKPNWDLCVRCGESLEGIAAAGGPRPAAASTPSAGEPQTDLGSFYLVLTLVSLGGLAVACRQLTKEPPPPAPTPLSYALGGPPSVPPPAPKVVAGPGFQESERARRLLAEGKAAEAADLLQTAIAADPQNATYRELLGQAQWQAGSRAEALAAYAEAARLDPDTHRLGYARALEMAGQKDAAIAELAAVVSAHPENTAAEDSLGRLYYDSGNHAAALPYLERTAARTGDLVVLQQLAYAADASGDHERAASTYRDLLQRMPRAHVARSLLAENLVSQGRPEEAVTLLQDGIQAFPNAPLLQRGLGSALERSGRASEAIAAYRAYARQAPNAPDAAEITARADRLQASQPSKPAGDGS